MCFYASGSLKRIFCPFFISSHPPPTPPPHLPPPSVLAIFISPLLHVCMCEDSGAVLIQLPHAILTLPSSHKHAQRAVCHLWEIVWPAVGVGGREIGKQRASLRWYLFLSSDPVLSASPFIASSQWIAAICPSVTATPHTLNLRS